jgi:L-gulonolactone oxidase
LGLTGLITWVELELAPVGSAQFEVETEPFGSLDAFWDLNEQSVAAWPYTVAWIDCTQSGRALGRGVYSRGRHRARGPLTARPPARGLPVPLDAPSFLLSPPLLRAFNALYYGAKRLRAGAVVQHYAPFLYPLDGLSGWNRLYGRAGLYQYQLVVPWTSARPAIAACLREIARTGEGSFLAVLKSFGEHAPAGMLSFPRAGVTLALDFRNRGAATLALMARLDAIVMEAGGRLYPAKDGRMPAEVFRAGYPRWREFAAHVDPAFGSDFWRRVSS